MESTDNPIAGHRDTGSLVARLEDGQLTEREAILEQQRTLEEMQKLVAAMRSDGASGVAPEQLEAAIRSTVSRLGSAPSNWHQMVVYYASSDDPQDADMRVNAPYLFIAGCIMVFMQLSTVFGIIFGAELPSCETNSQCTEGAYCRLGMTNRCEFCDSTPLRRQVDPVTSKVLNDRSDPNFLGRAEGARAGYERWNGYNSTYALELCAMDPEVARTAYGGVATDHEGNKFTAAAIVAWCDGCIHPTTGTVDGMNSIWHSHASIESMDFLDWMALCFCVFVVSLKLVAELKE
jgi:hypothetical protein